MRLCCLDLFLGSLNLTLVSTETKATLLVGFSDFQVAQLGASGMGAKYKDRR